MFLYYKNSFLASVVSLLGCISILIVVIDPSYYATDAVVTMICIGIVLLICGKLISDEKVFKTWWQQVKDAGLDEKMKTDVETAKYVYSKNPRARTLKEIAKRNPEAAALIRARK